MLLVSTRMLLHSLAVLAEKWESGVRMNCKDIEREVGLNERTISVGLTKLAKSGILDSITGGRVRGYKFARDPKDVYLSEVIEIVEGKCTFHCGKEIIDGMSCGNTKENCRVYRIYEELYVEVKEKLGELSVYEYALACKVNHS